VGYADKSAKAGDTLTTVTPMGRESQAQPSTPPIASPTREKSGVAASGQNSFSDRLRNLEQHASAAPDRTQIALPPVTPETAKQAPTYGFGATAQRQTISGGMSRDDTWGVPAASPQKPITYDPETRSLLVVDDKEEAKRLEDIKRQPEAGIAGNRFVTR